jgi:2-hydroxy-6-oxonona-2,4-dienedioate hydrolase
MGITIRMSLVSDEERNETMDFINILGYNIRYIKIDKVNSNETMILLHGIGASAERWSELVPLIDNYNMIIPDIIGFGYSEKPRIEYNIDLFVRFLDELFLKFEVKNPIMVGSSFGGQLILEYYFRHKEFFKKMILVSPAGTQERPTLALRQYTYSSLYPTRENTERAFKMMSHNNQQVKDSTIKDFINRMKQPNAKHSFVSTLLALRKNSDLQDNLKEIKIPTLVIWGENDTTIPVENIEYFRDIPFVKTHIMEGCGHVPFVENPIEFYKIAKKFIES